MGIKIIKKSDIHAVYRLSIEEKQITLSLVATLPSDDLAREKAGELAREHSICTSSYMIAPPNATSFPSLFKAIRLIRKHQRAYVEDFYWYDINKLMRYQDCVWGIRPSGTVLIQLRADNPMSQKEKKDLLEYASYYLENVEHQWYHWTPEKIKKLTLEESKRRIFQALNA